MCPEWLNGEMWLMDDMCLERAAGLKELLLGKSSKLSWIFLHFFDLLDIFRFRPHPLDPMIELVQTVYEHLKLSYTIGPPNPIWSTVVIHSSAIAGA
uniref:Uncharacterized protein n=1 Tax=Sphaerodactylus townsendi TaxID=933632 RepID=A0ACB8FMK3_9SAUR